MAATACILETFVNTQALCSTSCEPYVSHTGPMQAVPQPLQMQKRTAAAAVALSNPPACKTIKFASNHYKSLPLHAGHAASRLCKGAASSKRSHHALLEPAGQEVGLQKHCHTCAGT